MERLPTYLAATLTCGEHTGMIIMATAGGDILAKVTREYWEVNSNFSF
jgi:hypothetical protein